MKKNNWFSLNLGQICDWTWTGFSTVQKKKCSRFFMAIVEVTEILFSRTSFGIIILYGRISGHRFMFAEVRMTNEDVSITEQHEICTIFFFRLKIFY